MFNISERCFSEAEDDDRMHRSGNECFCSIDSENTLTCLLTQKSSVKLWMIKVLFFLLLPSYRSFCYFTLFMYLMSTKEMTDSIRCLKVLWYLAPRHLHSWPLTNVLIRAHIHGCLVVCKENMPNTLVNPDLRAADFTRLCVLFGLDCFVQHIPEIPDQIWVSA